MASLAPTPLFASAPESVYAAIGIVVSIDATRTGAEKLVVKKGATYNLGIKPAEGAEITYKSLKPKVAESPCL